MKWIPTRWWGWLFVPLVWPAHLLLLLVLGVDWVIERIGEAFQ